MRSATRSSGLCASWAPASSRASGIPSRRRQISAAAPAWAGSPSRRSGAAAPARSVKSASASLSPVHGSGPISVIHSPTTSSGCRLVTSTVTAGAAVSRSPTRSRQAATRCSQESRTSNSRLSASHSQSAATGVRAEWSASPTASQTAATSSWSRRNDQSGAHRTPSGKRGAAARAARIAIRVLPTPPGPVRVISRCWVNSRCSCRSSARRPTKLVDSSGMSLVTGPVCRTPEGAHSAPAPGGITV